MKMTKCEAKSIVEKTIAHSRKYGIPLKKKKKKWVAIKKDCNFFCIFTIQTIYIDGIINIHWIYKEGFKWRKKHGNPY